MSIYTVIEPPAHTRLTTPAAVVAFMNQGDPASPQLAAMVDAASAAIVGYCKGRVFGRQQVQETFRERGFEGYGQYHQGDYREHSGRNSLVLRCAPVVSIDAVIADGTAADVSLYQVDAEAGLLYALDSTGVYRRRFGVETVVTYTAGWLLPEDDGPNLPTNYQTAAILTAIALLQGSGRDPALRAVQTEGVGSYAYDTSQNAELVPLAAQSLLTGAILDVGVS
jgi:hypothetical protein